MTYFIGLFRFALYIAMFIGCEAGLHLVKTSLPPMSRTASICIRILEVIGFVDAILEAVEMVFKIKVKEKIREWLSKVGTK